MCYCGGGKLSKLVSLHPAWNVVIAPHDGAIDEYYETTTVIAANYTDAVRVALAFVETYAQQTQGWIGVPVEKYVVVSVARLQQYIYAFDDRYILWGFS